MAELTLKARATADGQVVVIKAEMTFELPEAMVVPMVIGWSTRDEADREVGGKSVRVQVQHANPDQQGAVRVTVSLFALDKYGNSYSVEADSAELTRLLTQRANELAQAVDAKLGDLCKLAERVKEAHEAGLLFFVDDVARDQIKKAVELTDKRLTEAVQDHQENHKEEYSRILHAAELTDKRFDELWKALETMHIKRPARQEAQEDEQEA